MKGKKEGKSKSSKANSSAVAATPIVGEINNEADLKAFLLNIRDKMVEETAPPIFAVTAMNQILITSDISNLLNNENKEIARDIWLRIKQSGYQMRNPSMLFGVEDIADLGLNNP